MEDLDDGRPYSFTSQSKCRISVPYEPIMRYTAFFSFLHLRCLYILYLFHPEHFFCHSNFLVLPRARFVYLDSLTPLLFVLLSALHLYVYYCYLGNGISA